MKKIALSLLLLNFSLSCQHKEKSNLFTEDDAYSVVNTFIADQKGKPVLWNNSQLVGSSIEYTMVSFDEIPVIPHHKELPFPVFTKAYWKTEKLKNIVAFDSKEYDYFFANENRKQNEIDKRKKEWQTRFKDNFLYNVSYPIYNATSKVAILDVYFYKTPLYCGTGLHQTYFYKKTITGWKKL